MKSLSLALILLLFLIVPARGDVTVVDLPVKDLVYVSSAELLYCSVPGSAGMLGNSIVRVDPTTGSVAGSVVVGSEPNLLGIARGSDTLYVGLDGSGSVRTYNVITHSLGAPVSLGQDSFGENYVIGAFGLSTVPNGLVALGLQTLAFTSLDTVVYLGSSGIVASRFEGPFLSGNGLFAGPLPNRQYVISPFGIRRISSTQNGFAYADQERPSGVGVYRTAYHRGLIYRLTGEIVDPETGAVVSTVTGLGNVYAVLPDSATNRIYYLEHTGTECLIKAYDIRTQQFVDSQSIDEASFPTGRFIRWGEDGFAFPTEDGELILLTSDIVGGEAPEADLNVTLPAPTQVPAGTPTSYTFTVTNQGPDPATAVTLHASWEREVNITAVTPSQGTGTFFEGVAVARVGDLDVGESATVSVDLRFRLSGTAAYAVFVQSLERSGPSLHHFKGGVVSVGPPTGAELRGSFTSAGIGKIKNGRGKLTATVEIGNLGLGAAGSFNVRFVANTPGSEFTTPLGTVRVKKLASNRAVRVSFSKKTFFNSGDRILAFIDDGNGIDEANERDNTLASNPIAIP
jgi:trimeric autotransporter adhesin